MKWSRQLIFLVIFNIVELVQFSHVNAEELPIVNSFSKDWKIDGNDSLVYSRSFNRHHEFAYINCDNANKFCHVNVIYAENADYHQRTCSLRQDLIQGKTGKMSLYLADTNYSDSKQIVQSWWLKNEDGRENRLTSLDLRSCMTNRYLFQPVEGDPIFTHVIPYKYPNFDLVYDKKRSKFVASLAKGKNGPAWNLDKKYKHMFGERAVELDSFRGFFYLGTVGESEGKFSVIFANSSSQQERELAVIENSKKPTQNIPATTGAQNKYGLCWRTLDGDKQVSCTQFDPDGQRTIKEMNFDAMEDPQWIAVYNLENSAMLVATGTCNDGKCNEFYITKIDASGHKSTPVKVDNLNAESPDSPTNITVDIAEDPEKNIICFNVVSLNNKHNDPSDDKPSKNLQYRRKCFNKNDIKNLD